MTHDNLRAALAELLDYAEANECPHEDTYRGGAIWTICRDCDRKWADDEGGFPGYQEPEAITKARAALSAPEPAPREVPVVTKEVIEAFERAGNEVMRRVDDLRVRVENVSPAIQSIWQEVVKAAAKAWHDSKAPEPAPAAPSDAKLRDVIDWLLSGDTGMSSKAIVTHMLGSVGDRALMLGGIGTREPGCDPPWDADDRGRCIRLLQRFPEWQSRLDELAELSEEWAEQVPLIRRELLAAPPSEPRPAATEAEPSPDLTDAEQSVWQWVADTLGLSHEHGEELAQRLVGLRYDIGLSRGYSEMRQRAEAAERELAEAREKLAQAENTYRSGDACSPEMQRIRDLEVTVCEQARIIASIRDTVSL